MIGDGESKVIIKVNPLIIQNYVNLSYDLVYNHAHTIYKEDWDLNLGLFQERLAVKGVYEHFVNNKKWEDTEYFIARLENRYGDIRGRVAILEYLNAIDTLYESIKIHGVIEGYQGWHYTNFTANEIGIAITRYNEVVFAHDGQHRLAISQILQLPQVPVRVIVQYN